jgi:hypothetical protein
MLLHLFCIDCLFQNSREIIQNQNLKCSWEKEKGKGKLSLSPSAFRPARTEAHLLHSREAALHSRYWAGPANERSALPLYLADVAAHAVCHRHPGPTCKRRSRRLHPQAAGLAPFLNHHRQIINPISSFPC